MKIIVFISSLLSAALISYTIANFKTGLTLSGYGTAFFCVGAIWFCIGAGLLSTNVKRRMYDDIDKKSGLTAKDMKHQLRTIEVGTSAGFSFDNQAGNEKYISKSISYGFVLAITGIIFLVAAFYLASQS